MLEEWKNGKRRNNGISSSAKAMEDRRPRFTRLRRARVDMK
jgi:hypothetical protein